MVMQRARRFLTPIVAAAAAGAALIAAFPASVHADPPPSGEPLTSDFPTQFTYPIGGTTGWDISWPQCPKSDKPDGPVNFAIIGVNGGRMNTYNECISQQWSWASRGLTLPQVYINTNGVPADYVSPQCDKADKPCNAYMYGYDAAVNAVKYARSHGIDPLYWWLDVETANAWNDDKFLNERTIGGAIEYLQVTGHILGIYSTPYQWNRIAGGFAPGLMNWTAGAADLADAMTRCVPKYAFGGGKVVMVQYVSERYDTSYICPNTGIGRRAILPAISAGN